MCGGEPAFHRAVSTGTRHGMGRDFDKSSTHCTNVTLFSCCRYWIFLKDLLKFIPLVFLISCKIVFVPLNMVMFICEMAQTWLGIWGEGFFIVTSNCNSVTCKHVWLGDPHLCHLWYLFSFDKNIDRINKSFSRLPTIDSFGSDV